MQGQPGYHAGDFFCPDATAGARWLPGKLNHEFPPFPEKADFVNRLIGEFPNLTVIDVADILCQLQRA